MIRLLLILLPILCHGQTDARWTLLADSSVVVPYHDLKTAAGYRLASDAMRRTAVMQIAELSGEVSALRDAVRAGDMQAEALRHAATLCDADRSEVVEARDQWKNKAQRRGRGVGVWIAVSVVLALILIAQ